MEIIFTGDFSSSGIFSKKIRMQESIFDIKILDAFKHSDFVHLNLENPITDGDYRNKKGICLKAPLETAEYLKEHGVNICTLANNHIMDCGINGIKDTISLLEKNGIAYYGIGGYDKYIILKKNQLKIALIASVHKEGPLWNGTGIAPFNFNLEQIRLLVNEIKSKEDPDYIIYNYHGGTEFNIIPEPKRRSFFKKLIETGINVVIGHHAHVPQGIEEYKNGIIVYGLGNFCFDIDAHRNVPYTEKSFFVKIKFEIDNNISIDKFFYNIDVEKGFIENPLNIDEAQHFFTEDLQVFDRTSDYRFKWEKEAFRVYFNNRPSVDVQSAKLSINANNVVPFNEKSMINLINDKRKNDGTMIWSILVMKKLYLDTTHVNRRPLLFGAIIYLIRRRFCI